MKRDDWHGEMTPEKAARLIRGMTDAEVVLAITGDQRLIYNHTVSLTGPLPSAVVLAALGERIRREGPR